MIPGFNQSKVPNILFGKGHFRELGKLANTIGKCVLIITGKSSLKSKNKDEELQRQFKSKNNKIYMASVEGEPSPNIIDAIVSEYRNKDIKVVMAIGGGSVIDAGKAVSAMLMVSGSVKDYLEGVGTLTHDGSKIPFIAVPTTAGTGSEATKNAVITQPGEAGFKKSLRHDNFIPDIALVDPELTLSCSPDLTAACGMDALSQLVESFISVKASKMTDALALSGIKCVGKSLVPACTDQGDSIEIRSDLAYASLTSGITLASAGLCVVHGIAGPLGGFFQIPHGVACATLLAEAMKITIQRLREMGKAGLPHLTKIAEMAGVISECQGADIHDCGDAFVSTIEQWIETLKIPKLGQYGISAQDTEKIAAAASNKNNPIQLSRDDMIAIITNRL